MGDTPEERWPKDKHILGVFFFPPQRDISTLKHQQKPEMNEQPRPQLTSRSASDAGGRKYALIVKSLSKAL